jgi:hypothetical protein
MMCRATIPPTGDVCGKLATLEVHWPDRDLARVEKTPVCPGCALALSAVAESHGTRLKVEKIDGDAR